MCTSLVGKRKAPIVTRRKVFHDYTFANPLTLGHKL